jgi:hypothetical protein
LADRHSRGCKRRGGRGQCLRCISCPSGRRSTAPGSRFPARSITSRWRGRTRLRHPFTDAALTTLTKTPWYANGIGYLDPVYLDPAISYRVRIYDADARSASILRSRNTILTFRRWQIGGYGPRQFGNAIAPSANVGAINIPASANCGPHSAGLAGYAKTASTTTGAVGLFGEGNAAAAGVLAWGGNFRVQDNGFAVDQIWGLEADANVTHAGTVAVGVDSVGGSTAIPDGASSAFRAGPVGTFQNPAIPWGRGFFADDGANLIAMEVGALKRVGDTGATSQPSQPLHFYYLNGGGVRTLGLVAQVTSAALASLIGDVRIGGSFGYATGYGGAVTQATSKSTGVTLNKICGAITMNNASLAANTIVGFILTNSMIAADDIVHVWVKSGNASVGSYRANSEGNTSGARTIILENKTAGSLSEAIVLGFTVIKSVIA